MTVLISDVDVVYDSREWFRMCGPCFTSKSSLGVLYSFQKYILKRSFIGKRTFLSEVFAKPGDIEDDIINHIDLLHYDTDTQG